MTLRQYLLLMTIGTLLCWGGWGVTLASVNPTDATTVEFGFFYVSLFLALVGTGSIVGLGLRRLFLKDDELIFRHVKNAFRQSVLIALTILILLMLLAGRLLTWWNAPLLILLAVCVETLKFTQRKFRNTLYGS